MKQGPNKKINQQLAAIFGFSIHPNYGINLAILYGLNLILGAVVIGLFSTFFPLVQTTMVSFIFTVAILTLLEYIILILIFRFFPQAVFYSFGTVIIVVDALLLLFVDLIINNFTFLTPRFETIVTFTAVLLILRWAVALYIKKILQSKGEK